MVKIQSVLCSHLQFAFVCHTLPNSKTLDMSRMKVFADDVRNVSRNRVA